MVKSPTKAIKREKKTNAPLVLIVQMEWNHQLLVELSPRMEHSCTVLRAGREPIQTHMGKNSVHRVPYALPDAR